jgi:ketosteroid isomerase-like protein
MSTDQTIANAIIEWECLKLCHAFAHAIDAGDFERVVNCFTLDGTFLREGHLLKGRDAMREAFRHRPSVTTVHLVSNFLPLSVTPERVTASVYNASISTFDKSEPIRKFDPQDGVRLLRFSDTYALTGEGWRIADRHVENVLITPNWPGGPAAVKS